MSRRYKKTFLYFVCRFNVAKKSIDKKMVGGPATLPTKSKAFPECSELKKTNRKLLYFRKNKYNII
jgi:hypothetical protein